MKQNRAEEKFLATLASAMNSFGGTAVHGAALNGNCRAIEKIASCIEDSTKLSKILNSQDYDGLTALHCCCRGISSKRDPPAGSRGDHLETLRLLLNIGADCTICDYSEGNALFYLSFQCLSENALPAIDLLLEAGCDPTVEDALGWNSLHAAHASCLREKDGEHVLSVRRKIYEKLSDHVRKTNPSFFDTFDKDKPRNFGNAANRESGPQRSLTAEQKFSVLHKNLSLEGIADFIKRRLSPSPSDQEGSESSSSSESSPSSGKGLKIVVMAGAGMSVAAGIPDYRSGKGIYTTGRASPFTAAALQEDPEKFFGVVRQMIGSSNDGTAPKPTLTHWFVRLLAEKGLLLRLYTQNVDGLETLTGLDPELFVEAHGNLRTGRCTKCQRAFEQDEFKAKIQNEKVPLCPDCSAIVRPNVVFFGEPLSTRFFRMNHDDLEQADLLIVIGTTLVVYPFASLTNKVSPLTPRVLFNNEPSGPFTKWDSEHNYRDVFCPGPCDSSVSSLLSALSWSGDLAALSSVQ